MVTPISKTQFNALLRGLPIYRAPVFSTAPYLPSEILEGDTVTPVAGSVRGYPAITTNSPGLTVGGIGQSSPYTSVIGDASKTIVASQTVYNSMGVTTGYSSGVTIGAQQTIDTLNYLGGNCAGSLDYNTVRLFNNAIYDSRGFGIQGANAQTYTPIGTGTTLTFSATSGSGVTMTLSNNSTIALTGDIRDNGKLFSYANNVIATVTAFISTTVATVTITGTLSSNVVAANAWSVDVPRDTNGFPTIASSNVITAGLGGADGQLAAGTYTFSYKSPGQTTNVTISGGTLTNKVISGDGVTISYTLTLATNATVTLNFSGQITAADIPRDGSASSSGQPLFTAAALAYHSQFTIIRSMDFTNTNARTDSTWAQRYPNWNVYPGRYSWELLFNFALAVKNYPGSRFKKLWINIPYLAISSDVATNLATLITTMLGNSLTIYVENSNEQWNGQFPTYINYLNNAMAEAQEISSYGSGVSNNVITGIVQNGTTHVVTVSGTLPSFITVGAQFLAFSMTNLSFNLGSIASPATITTVSSNTFTYNSTYTTSPGTQYGYVFNLSTNLVTDNLSFDIYDMGLKYQTRKHYQNWQAWYAVRSQDRFVLGMQIQAPLNNNLTNGFGYIPRIQFAYSVYIGGGSSNWVYGAAFAPYVQSALTTSPSTGGADINGLFANMTANLNGFITNAIRGHIYSCKSYGFHPLAYEAGPDLQYNGPETTAACTDPRMGAQITALLNLWFQSGGEDICFFSLTPSTWSNGGTHTTAFQGQWPICQSYSDTASVKLVAFLAAYSNPKTYYEIYNTGSILLASQFWHAYGGNCVIGNGTTTGASGVFYWYSATSARQLDWYFTVNRTRRYVITLWGTDSVATTQAQVYIDNVLIGTVTLVQGGAANSITSTPGASAPINVSAISSGPHVLSVKLPGQATGLSGLQQIVISQY